MSWDQLKKISITLSNHRFRQKTPKKPTPPPPVVPTLGNHPVGKKINSNPDRKFFPRASMPESTSGKLVEAETQLISFPMRKQVFPGDFTMREAGHAAQHAAESGFDAGGDLVVAVAGGDAVDESALLVAVGEREVVAECAVGGELARSRNWRG
jgi:hypothetical protein